MISGRSLRPGRLIAVVVALLSGVLVAGSAGVLVDQVGYRPTSPKYVFTSEPADSFHVIRIATGEVVFRGVLSLWRPADLATGLDIRRGDFSGLTVDGRYLIETSLGDRSEAFTVSDTVYAPLVRAALKGFFYQRCGAALPYSSAGQWLHGYCHTADGSFHSAAESTGTAAAAGGWHDAGDYGKYVVNAGITVGTLLLAYDLFPERFSGDDVGIPESGNGIPDLLDETRVELEWMLRMQSAGGGVFTKLTKPQFEPFVMPHLDTGTRYIYQISSTATGDLAAVMARASATFRGFDPSFADRCLSAAEKAWTYLAEHPSIVPPGGFVNPSGTSTGEYGDPDDRDERLWAAAELFVATGKAVYGDAYALTHADRGLVSSGISWQHVTSLAHIAYLLGADRTREPEVVTAVGASLRSTCDALMARRAVSGLHLTLVPGDFVWGSNASALNDALLLIVGARTLGVTSYLAGAEDQLHYVLGVNPHRMSFVTGAGTVRPLHPHHRPSAADAVVEPVPGLLVGGPNQYGGDQVLDAIVAGGAAPALCYADDQNSYASNEVAINWNAPLVFVAGALSRETVPTGVPSGSEVPRGGAALLPAYPNPFNPSTTVTFRVTDRGPVELSVFDLAGRTVQRLVASDLPPGEFSTTWDAGRFPSGVYVLRLQCVSGGFTQKMVLLK